MSEITERPRVLEVAAAGASSLPSAAGVLLGALAVAVLSEAVRAIVRACSDSLASRGPLSTIASPDSVRSARASTARRAEALISTAGLAPLDAAKALALAAPMAEPLVAIDAGGLLSAVEKVATAADLEAVETARLEVVRELDRQHGEAFQGVLLKACSEASRLSGFPQIEVYRSEDLARVQALDGAGHALVSEIRLDAAGAASVATEALGWRGHECQRVLDRFNRALEEQGVRSNPPKRRSTYGVACLGSSRDLERRLKPEPLGEAERRSIRALKVPTRAAGRGRS